MAVPAASSQTAPGVDTVAYWASVIGSKWGSQYSAGYIAYMDDHPGLDPATGASDYVETVLVQSLDTSVSTGVQGASAAESAVPGALTAGAGDVYKSLSVPDFLGKLWTALSSAHTWIRVAEGVLGIALVIVAADELTRGTAANTAVHKVRTAAMLLWVSRH